MSNIAASFRFYNVESLYVVEAYADRVDHATPHPDEGLAATSALRARLVP